MLSIYDNVLIKLTRIPNFGSCMSHSLPLQDPGRMVFVMDPNLKYHAQNGDPKNGQYKFVIMCLHM